MSWATQDAPVFSGVGQKLWRMHWPVLIIVAALVNVGVFALYAAAGGAFDPWAELHMLRALAGLGVLCLIATLSPRFIMGLAYPIYLVALGLLVLVALHGVEFGGARRWLDAGGVRFQPSEFMKIALVLALARYYQWLPAERVSRPLWVLVPVLLIAVPLALVVKQPDLGTALLIAVVGGGIMFLAGVSLYYFAGGIAVAGGAAPFLWDMLHEYQRQRVMTFLDPERDPLGAGYHILQSKIAIGSGGIFGKGYLGGTQNQLSFLPEKQTDFIFTLFAEEQGFVGGVALLALYVVLIALVLMIALVARNRFLKLITMGVVLTISIYVFVNVAMVMGLVPVVGVPLPLVSYGGTAMITIMVALGLAMNAHVHRGIDYRREQLGAIF